MSSSDGSVSFKVTGQDDGASASINAVIEVMQKGSMASQDVIAQFKAMRSNTSLQTRAMSELRSEWNADNASLVMFGRAMSNVGAIGSTVLGITNSLLLAQLTLATSGSSLAAAQATQINAQEQLVAAEALYPPGSVQIIQAQGAVITSTNQASTVLAQHKLTLTTTSLTYAGVALSIAGVVAQVITAMGGFAALSGAIGGVTTIGVAITATIVGIVAAAVALGVVLGVIVGIFLDMTLRGMSLKEAIGSAWTAMGKVPVIGGILQGVVSGVGDVLTAFTKLPDALGPVWTEISGAIKVAAPDIESAMKAIWSTVTADATKAWDDIKSDFTVFWTDMTAVISSVAGNVTGAVKNVINGVIQVINNFINGIDAAIKLLNSVASVLKMPTLPLIPDIPMLAEGGIVTAPTLAVLGEGGPEAVIPLSASGGLGGGGSAGGTTIVIQAQGSIFSQTDLVTFLDQAIQQRLALRRK